ncbi:hypothetical protein BDW59DRAFT_141549 [Aspergillus cavernicola]|uniref:EH domain-containing protein n=1 Tax=Aspergillus cavernicola TaxID=176166 RepID=A0ABR4IQF7_9EURO
MAKATPSRDRRLPPRNNNNNSPSSAALQGALLAFNYATPPKKIMADPPPISLLDSDPDPPPELPEPGSIRDKIAKFSADSTAPIPNNRPRTALGNVPDITRQKSPQILAAEIATRSSPAPSSKTTGVDVHRVQSQRNANLPNRGLPSPTPIRKTPVHHHLLDPSLDDSYGFPLTTPPIEQTPASPKPLTSPRPPITKPRPVPPAPRRSSPISSELAPSRNHPERLRHYDESPSGHFPLRSKASASTLSEDPAPALPPRRSTTMPTKDAREHQVVPGRVRSPLWPSSSSVTSLYSQSQNPSSSSMLDSLSNMSNDGPSDAIAASSLASNRALQAKKSPPPPPPHRRRRSRSRSLLQIKKDRTPNPSPGGLRETLRPQAKSDDDEDQERRHRQHRNRIINKHPHKHQEGDRKRWRSEITEKERKRYEGIWAANKGLLIPPSQVLDKKVPTQEIPSDLYPPTALDMVVNLVVQDIWTRSRLPNHVLEQIWGLVDGQKIGLLTRAEFVVGMWLIDQQLKGHKLPAVIPDSVWASVMRVPGISLDDLRP